MDSVKCARIRLVTETKRRLWSESGGYCQNPSCTRYLFADGSEVDFAEMAHIIPASANGPRDVSVTDVPKEERAHHSNIVVLCAICHTVADKDPGTHPAELMHQWKERHRYLLERTLGTPSYSTRPEARKRVTPLLAANRLIYDRYGPKSGEFSDATASRWHRHVRGTILPNNREILRVLEMNRDLLRTDEADTINLFALHVRELEHRHLLNDWTAGSTRFPDELTSILDGEP